MPEVLIWKWSNSLRKNPRIMTVASRVIQYTKYDLVISNVIIKVVAKLIYS